MKKIKIILAVALFGIATFGAYSSYNYSTMSADEKALIENIEALTDPENGLPECPSTSTINGDKVIFSHAKNRWMGIVAGCKYDCRFTCTVKDFVWPEYN